MSDTVTVIVGHRLGKIEAVRRLKEGLARTDGHLGAMIAIDQETWEGDTLRFRMRALGQTAAATIEVLEDALRIEVSLPWLLAEAAKRPLPVLRQGGGATPGEKIKRSQHGETLRSPIAQTQEYLGEKRYCVRRTPPQLSQATQHAAHTHSSPPSAATFGTTATRIDALGTPMAPSFPEPWRAISGMREGLLSAKDWRLEVVSLNWKILRNRLVRSITRSNVSI